MIPSLFALAFYLIQIMIYLIIFDAVFSLLASFSVIDTRNRVVWTIGDFLHRATEPLLRPIRNVLPNFGGLDLSPWAAILLLQFVVAPLLGNLRAGVLYNQWSLM